MSKREVIPSAGSAMPQEGHITLQDYNQKCRTIAEEFLSEKSSASEALLAVNDALDAMNNRLGSMAQGSKRVAQKAREGAVVQIMLERYGKDPTQPEPEKFIRSELRLIFNEHCMLSSQSKQGNYIN